jgi:methylphosphonate synthase
MIGGKMSHHARVLAARVLSEANDLKRTPEMLADDLGIARDDLRHLLAGECDVRELHALIERIAAAYPVDSADLRIPEDDCDHGARIVRAATSVASRRVSHRADPRGGTSPYYEYRDTAFSRLSPFRPEWIRPLRLVTSARADDPMLVYNQGHLLHQYTYYVDGVNFYWRTGIGQDAAEMETGDSTYGTPWWPHTFAARDPERRGYILAVTFGAQVRRAQRELYALGRRTHFYVIDYRHPRRAAIELLDHHLASEMMSRAELCARCRDAGTEVSGLFDEAHLPTAVELGAAARVLTIEPADLHVPAYTPADEVVRVRRAESTPSEIPLDSPRYRVWRMARLSRMPQVKGFGLDVLVGGTAPVDLTTGLHAWIYNYGDAAVSMAWSDGETHRTSLAPGDSIYLQPFIAHGFAREDRQAALCVVRVPGAVDLATQRELSYLSEVDRVYFEDRTWA